MFWRKQIKLFLLREYYTAGLEAKSATFSWKTHKRQFKNRVSSAGSAGGCLSVTLICICNQMNDWKAAYRSQKHGSLSQALLSVCLWAVPIC